MSNEPVSAADLAAALREATEVLAALNIEWGLPLETEINLAQWTETLETWESERAVWDRDRADVMLCATRYAMNRMTTMPSTVQRYIRNSMGDWPQLERDRLATLIDQEEETTQHMIDAGVIDAESVTAGSPLGNPRIDRPGWLALRDALRGGE